MNPKKHTIFTISALIIFAATFTYAEEIKPAEYKVGHINVGKLDTYTFLGNVGHTVTILIGEISGVVGFDPQVELHAPDGSVVRVEWGTSSATIEAHPLTQCGLWRIICRDHVGSHTGQYGLSLIRNPGRTTHESDPNGGPIAPGQTKTGTIKEGDLDAFTFWGKDGDTVTILMGEISGEVGFDPQVELHAPDGNVVTTPGWGISSETIQAQHLTQTGTYFIITRDHDGYHTGQYGLSLINNPGHNKTDPDGGPIAPGEKTKGGTIGVGDLDAFTFSANAGDTVTILMGEISGEVGFDPQVELHAPDGNVVTTPRWGISSVTIQAQRLTQTGTYFIITRDHDGYHTGQYGLSLIKNPGPNKTDPDGGPIRGWDPNAKTGTIDVGDLDAFTFSANAGDTVTILMGEISGEVGFDPQVELHAPDGNVVTIESGISSATIQAQQLTQTGTYFIITRDHDGYNTGQYGLSLSRSNVLGTPAIGFLSADPNLVVEGEPFTLTAHGANDPNGWIVQVDFYCDMNQNRYLDLDGTDQFLGSDTNDSDGWDWTGSIGGFPLVGVNTYFVRAMDNSGAWSDEVDCTGTVNPLHDEDFNGDGKVDFLDFSIFTAAWQTEPGDPEWNPVCDINQPPDDIIDFFDLARFTERWLEGSEPYVSQL